MRPRLPGTSLFAPNQYAFSIDSNGVAGKLVVPVEGLAMSGDIGERTICCIAENVAADKPETQDQIDCDFCGGKKAFRVIRDSVLIDTYSADPFLSGSLESYSFDGGASVNLPQVYDTPYIDIPLPKKFDHLCLRYNNEGGANITVVAVDIESGAGHEHGGKFRPKKQPAFGNDPACPIEQATLKKATGEPLPGEDGPLLDLSQFFVWKDTAATSFGQTGEDRGGFNCQPGEGQGDFTLWAKPTMPAAASSLSHYKFLRWERYLLSHVKPGTQIEWTEESSETTFNSDLFVGVIAYYELVTRDVDPDGPITLPQPREDGYPIPFNEIVLDTLAVFHRLEDLARGLFAPRRHAPGSTDHGESIGDVRIGEGERRLLIEFASAGEARKAELVALLEEIHARRVD